MVITARSYIQSLHLVIEIVVISHQTLNMSSHTSSNIDKYVSLLSILFENT